MTGRLLRTLPALLARGSTAGVVLVVMLMRLVTYIVQREACHAGVALAACIGIPLHLITHPHSAGALGSMCTMTCKTQYAAVQAQSDDLLMRRAFSGGPCATFTPCTTTILHVQHGKSIPRLAVA